MNVSKKFRVTVTTDEVATVGQSTVERPVQESYEIGGEEGPPPVGDVVMQLHRLNIGAVLMIERME